MKSAFSPTLPMALMRFDNLKARFLTGLLGCLFVLLVNTPVQGAMPDEFLHFLRESFGTDIPRVQRLWLNEQQRNEAGKLLQRPVRTRSLRYWGDASHIVWLLNEIGKERPITTAIEIRNGRVKRVRVITYRESRGGEVQAGWFLNQFYGLTREHLGTLNKAVDSISGATLSVNALKKQVSLALLAADWLKQKAATQEKQPEKQP